MSLSLVYLVKCINKPLYYGFHDKCTNKTNIVYFKDKEHAHKCKVSVNNYYHKHKKSPRIDEIKLNDLYENQSEVHFKVHSMNENYVDNYVKLGNLKSCYCVIDKHNTIWCMQKQIVNNSVEQTPMYFNILYLKQYSKDVYN